jgi:hypothetical protein
MQNRGYSYALRRRYPTRSMSERWPGFPDFTRVFLIRMRISGGFGMAGGRGWPAGYEGAGRWEKQGAGTPLFPESPGVKGDGRSDVTPWVRPSLLLRFVLVDVVGEDELQVVQAEV